MAHQLIPHGGARPRIAATIALVLAACAGCTSTVSESSGSASNGRDAVKDACSLALKVSANSPYLPPLTQCEEQSGGGGSAFILQFDDPVDNSIQESIDISILNDIEEPLSALEPVWRIARTQDQFATYIVSFRDSCATVWEISPDQMNQFLDAGLDAQALGQEMAITGSAVC